MIEDKKLGLKIAEDRYDQILHKIENDNKELAISQELNTVLIEYIKNKKKKEKPNKNGKTNN